MEKKKSHLFGNLVPLILFVVFGAIFWADSQFMDLRLLEGVTNTQVLDIFGKYSQFVGFALGFISMIGAYILLLIAKLFRLTKYSVTYFAIPFLMVLPWYFFARQLVYFENRYTELSRSIIFFIGEQLLDTTIFLLWILVIIVVVIIIKKLVKKFVLKKTALGSSLILISLFFGGCLGDLEGLICSFLGDSDHCFQDVAIQEADADECEKISGEDFADIGSNPPKDKCYLRIAENTGDLSNCDKIKGGLMSYTREECILNTSIKFNNASGCKELSGSDYATCVDKVGPKIDPWGIIDIDNQIKLVKEQLGKSSDDALAKQLEGLEKMRQDMLDVAAGSVKDKYAEISDPMYQEITGDYAIGAFDRETKEKLLNLNKSIKAAGGELSKEQYQSIKDYYAYLNDPRNDIEEMSDSEIIKKRWNEKLGAAVDYLKFWNSNPTAAEARYDEQLTFYTRMLERQAAIDAGLSELEEDVQRNLGVVGGAAGNYAQDKAQEAALEYIFGKGTSTATSAATAILGEALNTVKKEAKSAEFRGLVRAYDLGMQEEMAKNGGDVEKAHATVSQNMEKDPYTYEDSNSFAKYGNLIENKNCDGSNPHCINREVFWKSMKKSYKFQNKTN